MKVILFTNARDEAHIKEWVAHHLNLGFDFIHIFDHKSIEPIISQFKSNPKLNIKRIDYNSELFKESLMMKAKDIAIKDSYNWMLYLDADEFLVLNQHNTVQELLETYEEYNQVGFNWLVFGSNYLTTEPDGMILENYIRCNSILNMRIKTFVRPETIISTKSPHAYQTNNMKISINGITKKPLIADHPYHYPLPNTLYTDTPAYVAHYMYQSYDIYSLRKIALPRDDYGKGTAYRPTITEEDLHSSKDNEIINISIRDRYCEKNAELIKEL
jgi:hypothetical protein